MYNSVSRKLISDFEEKLKLFFQYKWVQVLTLKNKNQACIQATNEQGQMTSSYTLIQLFYISRNSSQKKGGKNKHFSAGQ